MSKKTHQQRLDRSPQPFTVVRTDGTVLHVFGYTPERRLNENDEFALVWEQHDLGTVSTYEIADKTAAEWRANLVGIYTVTD